MEMELDAVQQSLEALHSYSFGWALSCCSGNRDEAEEVLQITYLKILDGRAKFKGKSTLKTWLFAVIRRTAGERRRRRVLHRALLLKSAVADSLGESNPRDARFEVLRSEEATTLRRALGYLSRRQREVLELVFYHEQTVSDAAATMGISVGSARVHYARGKSRLAEHLRVGATA